jgi:hypothetical protein
MAYNLVQLERTIESIQGSLNDIVPKETGQPPNSGVIDTLLTIGQKHISGIELLLKTVGDLLTSTEEQKDE